MTKYVIKRLLQAIPLMLIITIISFLIITLAPGDPATMFINPEKMGHVNLALIRHNLGLDKPIIVRYFIWLKNLLTGNFGLSFFSNQPVLKLLFDALPNTMILAFAAMLFSVIVAIPAGIISAVKKGTILDYIFSVISYIGVSIPTFWFALMLLLLFGAKLHWLPIGGMRDNYATFDIVDRLKHLVIPAIVLGMGGMSTYMRFMRGSMLEVINQDYVRTARSKGLTEKVVILKHALRNALLPMITLLGFMIPDLISGAAMVETVVSWPGLGRIVVNANFERDYPVIMGDLVFVAVLVVIGSLVADVLYGVADPRIKYN